MPRLSIHHLTREAELTSFLQRLGSSSVGVDLEGRLGRFGAPSLLQLYSPRLQSVALVDVLENPRLLKPLEALLWANGKIQKVFHDCREDVAALRHWGVAARGSDGGSSSSADEQEDTFPSSSSGGGAVVSSFSSSSSSANAGGLVVSRWGRASLSNFDLNKQLPFCNVFDTQVAYLTLLERKNLDKYLCSLPELLRICDPELYRRRRWDRIEKSESFQWRGAGGGPADEDGAPETSDPGDVDSRPAEEVFCDKTSSSVISSSSASSSSQGTGMNKFEKRPLTPECLRYAVEGCVVLPRLAEILKQELRDTEDGDLVVHRTRSYLSYSHLNVDVIDSATPVELWNKQQLLKKQHKERSKDLRRAERRKQEKQAGRGGGGGLHSSPAGEYGGSGDGSGEDGSGQQESSHWGEEDEEERVFPGLRLQGFVTAQAESGATHVALNGMIGVALSGLEKFKVSEMVHNLKLAGANRKRVLLYADPDDPPRKLTMA